MTSVSTPTSQPRQFVLWRELLASSTPAVAWTLVGCPFNVVTVRLQTTSASQFTGAIHCLKVTVAEEGVTALWKGFTPSVLLSIPYSTCLFGIFAYCRPPRLPSASLVDPSVVEHPNTLTKHFLQVFNAGFASGLVLTLLQNPFDVWRVRLQAQFGKQSVLQKGSKDGVLRTLWNNPKLATRGLSMTAVRQMPGNGFFFATHEYLSMRADLQPLAAQFPNLTRFLVGGLTGVAFNTVFYPFEVIKARMMVTAPEQGGSLLMARSLLKEAGWRGFYRGLGVVLLRSFPVNALGFLTLHISQAMLAEM